MTPLEVPSLRQQRETHYRLAGHVPPPEEIIRSSFMFLESNIVPGRSKLSLDESQHTLAFKKLLFSGGCVIKA